MLLLTIQIEELQGKLNNENTTLETLQTEIDNLKVVLED